MKNRSGEKIKLASIDELLGVVNEESAMEIEISKMWRWEQHGSLPYFHLPELVCRTISFISLQISII